MRGESLTKSSDAFRVSSRDTIFERARCLCIILLEMHVNQPETELSLE